MSLRLTLQPSVRTSTSISSGTAEGEHHDAVDTSVDPFVLTQARARRVRGRRAATQGRPVPPQWMNPRMVMCGQPPKIIIASPIAEAAANTACGHEPFDTNRILDEPALRDHPCGRLPDAPVRVQPSRRARALRIRGRRPGPACPV